MHKIFNFRPLLFLAVGVCISIVISYLFILNRTVLAILLLLGVATVITLWLIFYSKDGKLKRNLIFVFVFIALFSFSIINFFSIYQNYLRDDTYGYTYDVSGRISEVVKNDDYLSVVLDNVKIDERDEYLGYKAKLYVYDDIKLNVGDVISFTAPVYSMSPFYEGRFSASYVASGIKYFISINEYDLTVLDNHKTVFEVVNHTIKETLHANLGEDEFSVAYALLCGNSDYVDGELIENYRSAGVAHIFAVSGLHVGFLASVLNFVLSKLKVDRKLQVILTFLILLFYCGVCGFSASSIRATIMCTVMLFAGAFGLKYDGLTSMSLSCIIVLLISPVQLFTVGFQLSFGVVVGMMILSRPIAKIFKFLPTKIANALGGVLSAQLVSIPICLYVFKSFSAISVVMNLVLIPVIGFVYVLLFVMTVLTIIFKIGIVFMTPVNYILVALNFLFRVIDYKIFMIGGITLGVAGISYYLALISASQIVNLTKKLRLSLVLSLSVITCIAVVATNISLRNNFEVCVVGSNGLCATMISANDEDVVVCSYVSTNANFTRLDKAFNRYDAKDIDYLIIQNYSGGADVQTVVSLFYRKYEIKNVYVCKEIPDDERKILEASFDDVSFFELTSSILKTDKFSFESINNGKSVLYTFNNNAFLICSKWGESASKPDTIVSTKIDFLIAHDYVEQFTAYYKPKDVVSYLQNVLYNDAFGKGNYYIKIK